MAILLCSGIFVGCNNTNKQSVEQSINYMKVEVGAVPFEFVDEYGDVDKYARQWMIENKETEGLYTKIFNDNTYIMYSMGEKKDYGYGFSSVELVKLAEKKPISLNLITTKPDASISTEEINYPYIVLKVKGNIKDEVVKNISELDTEIEPIISEETNEPITPKEDNSNIEGDLSESQ